MPEIPLLEVRIYQAGQVGYVSLLPRQVGSASWRTTMETGYDSASFTLATSQDTGSVTGLAKAGRRIEAWGRSRDGASLVRLWSGRIVQARRDAAPPNAFTISAVGVWSKVAKLLVRTPLVFSSRVDLSQAFAAAASSALSSSSESFQIDAPTIGLTTDSLEDAYEQPLRDAASALLGLGAGATSMGGDVVGDQPGETIGTAGAFGRERIYLRPFEDGASPARWTISLPDPALRIVRRQTEEDASRLANVLRIDGGALNNGNLLAAPTQGNTRLDRITRTGTAGGTNLLVDPGFELNTSWTYAGGASRKNGKTDVYGPPDGNGEWYTLLDNLGEKITQRPTVAGGVQVGRTYTFNARIRQATNKADGSASTDGATLKLRYFTVGGIQIGADVTAAITPAGAGVWRDAQVSAEAPATATQIEVEVELTTRTPGAAASTLGVAIDNTALYDFSQITQRGWFLTKKTGSSAVIARQNWQALGAGGAFGPYALEVSGASSDDYNNDWWLVPGTSPNEEIAAVSGGQGLTLSYWLKRLPDGSANPKLIIDIDWRDKSGAFISPSRATIAAGALTNSFVQYTLTASAPVSATGAIVRLRSRGNGGFVLDAAQLRDSSEVTTEFVQDDVWHSDHRASATAGLTAPQQASNALYGDVYEQVDEPLIRTQADADAYALAIFKARCLPVQRPSVEVAGHAEAWRPGQWLRAIGSEGTSFLASPLPIAEVEGRWEGGSLSSTLTLGAPPDTRQRLLQRLLEGVPKGGGNSSSQSYGAPSSGSALAYSGGGIPSGTSSGQLIRWDNALGIWVVNSVASLLDTGLTLTPAATGNTPLTIQGIASQTSFLADLKAGASQTNLFRILKSSGIVALSHIDDPAVGNALTIGSTSFGSSTYAMLQLASVNMSFPGSIIQRNDGALSLTLNSGRTTGGTNFGFQFFCGGWGSGTAVEWLRVSGAALPLFQTAVSTASSLTVGTSLIVGNQIQANVTNAAANNIVVAGISSQSAALVRLTLGASATGEFLLWRNSVGTTLGKITAAGEVQAVFRSSDGSLGQSIVEAGVTFKDGVRTAGGLLVPITSGGTGATTAAGARTNLGLGTAAVANTPATGDAAAGEVVLGADSRLKTLPREKLVVWEDFLNGATGPFVPGLGSLVSGAAAALSTYTDGATGFRRTIGAIQLQTGSTVGGRAAILHQQDGVNPVIVRFSENEQWFRARIQLPALSNGTDTYTVRAGFISVVTGDSVNGVYLRYSHGVNAGKWEFVTRQASTETATDTGIAASAATWVSVWIKVDAAGTNAYAYIDGTLVATNTTNIPTGSTQSTSWGAAINKSVGTGSSGLYIDAIGTETIRTAPF